MSGEKKRARTKGLGRAAFLAHKQAIQTKLEAGLPQVSIYDELASDLGISISQFNRYVAKYLRKEEKTDAPQVKGSTGTSGVSPAGTSGVSPAPAKKQTEQGRVGRVFAFDPDPKRKDLI